MRVASCQCKKKEVGVKAVVWAELAEVERAEVPVVIITYSIWHYRLLRSPEHESLLYKTIALLNEAFIGQFEEYLDAGIIQLAGIKPATQVYPLWVKVQRENRS